ncbi:hypothetical protein PanWU01x14_169210 [Parasponia andersonii]|uniref:Transmembrane protein n=1 Tax=Parasponia andersonii TaxID=3476 RepID=A0A2P5CAA3_PARAD|nr:hypothetical protein PanWU01x14_169210 [Parasponia andersonii]
MGRATEFTALREPPPLDTVKPNRLASSTETKLWDAPMSTKALVVFPLIVASTKSRPLACDLGADHKALRSCKEPTRAPPSSLLLPSWLGSEAIKALKPFFLGHSHPMWPIAKKALDSWLGKVTVFLFFALVFVLVGGTIFVPFSSFCLLSPTLCSTTLLVFGLRRVLVSKVINKALDYGNSINQVLDATTLEL